MKYLVLILLLVSPIAKADWLSQAWDGHRQARQRSVDQMTEFMEEASDDEEIKELRARVQRLERDARYQRFLNRHNNK